MRPKSLLAIILGLGSIALGVWRYSTGAPAAIVMVLVGVFLLFRGATGTVRSGL
jgi:hypothetical protein